MKDIEYQRRHIHNLLGWLEHYLNEREYDMAKAKAKELAVEIATLEHMGDPDNV